METRSTICDVQDQLIMQESSVPDANALLAEHVRARQLFCAPLGEALQAYQTALCGRRPLWDDLHDEGCFILEHLDA